MNINEEGKYYASMVRKFRTEYNSKNLHGFCKEQKVSYTKMLHYLRDDSYRKPGTKPVDSEEEQGLHPLLVDMSNSVAIEPSILKASFIVILPMVISIYSFPRIAIVFVSIIFTIKERFLQKRYYKATILLSRYLT